MNRCGTPSPIYPGDTGPVVCDLPFLHRGSHSGDNPDARVGPLMPRRSWPWLVPAPPEAPEPLKRVEDLLTVDEQAALHKDLAGMAAIRRRTAASDVVLGAAAPPTEEETP